MTSENLIQELERYRGELTKIMGRFNRSSKSYHIHAADDPRFRTFVIEIIDILNDSIGANQYSPLINQIFNEGISNFYESPSYKSVEDIVSVLASVITRLKRNPELCNPKKENATPDNKTINDTIKYPDKITLKWLRDHVPASFFWSFVLILFFMFCLGLKFADTKLYKSLIETYTANNNTVKKIEAPNK